MRHFSENFSKSKMRNGIAKKGSGREAAIARRLVEQIGGTVTVECGLATG